MTQKRRNVPVRRENSSPPPNADDARDGSDRVPVSHRTRSSVQRRRAAAREADPDLTDSEEIMEQLNFANQRAAPGAVRPPAPAPPPAGGAAQAAGVVRPRRPWQPGPDTQLGKIIAAQPPRVREAVRKAMLRTLIITRKMNARRAGAGRPAIPVADHLEAEEAEAEEEPAPAIRRVRVNQGVPGAAVAPPAPQEEEEERGAGAGAGRNVVNAMPVRRILPKRPNNLERLRALRLNLAPPPPAPPPPRPRRPSAPPPPVPLPVARNVRVDENQNQPVRRVRPVRNIPEQDRSAGAAEPEPAPRVRPKRSHNPARMLALMHNLPLPNSPDVRAGGNKRSSAKKKSKK